MSTDNTEPALRVCVLGSFSVIVNGIQVEESAWQRRNAQRLIKLLAATPQHRLHRDVLMHSFWPESPPEKASNNLNKVLYMARRALEPSLAQGTDSSFIRRNGEVVALVSDLGLDVDADQFEQAAKSALENADYDQLLSCSELYTGDLLAEDLFDDHFVPRRESLARLQQQVLLSLSEQAQVAQQLEKASDALNKLLVADPLNEDYHRRLICLYRDSNQRSKALHQFEKCQALVKTELDQTPDAQTMSLYRTLISPESAEMGEFKQPAITTADLPGQTSANHVLAVLPLENTCGSEKFDYLCDGITENLIVSLSRMPGQRVMARSTVFRYKDQAFDPARLRQELAIDNAVLGRVALHQGRIRVWVELVNTVDGVLLWAQHYDRELLDVQLLQRDVAHDLTTFFQSSLGLPTSAAIPEPTRIDPEAYHQYLKGRYHWNKRTGAALDTALGYFHSALDHDPVYALAWSGLADTWNVMSLITTAAPHDTMPKARAAAIRALEIDPRCCEAHTSLAYCQVSYDWHWQDAEASFIRALELNPSYATAHQWYHKLLVARGRFAEAGEQIAQAKQLDPLSLMISTEAGWGLYHSRRFDDAIIHLEKVLADDPQFALAHYLLGLARLQTGEFELAAENLQAAGARQQGSSPSVLQSGALGYAYARSGHYMRAQTCLETLQSGDSGSGSAAYASAVIHMGTNNHEMALAALRQAFDARLDRLIFLHVEPLFDPLRNHPQFTELCQQLNS